MLSLYLIAFVVLFVLFYSLLIKLRARKARKGSSIRGSFELPVDVENRRYIAENVPALLVGYNVFVPSFLSRFSAEYLATGHFARFNADELVEGVDPDHASWVLNHCCRLASARYNNLKVIQNAENVEAEYVVLKLFQTNPSCPFVPKKDKKYKAKDEIPLFPCADCKEDKICGIWYKLDWD
jgi:hypothetical protein